MPLKVAIIYNDPFADSPDENGESEAIVGVLEEVVAVKKALIELGHQVQQVALRKPLETVKQTIRDIKADLIFNLFEGFDDDPNTEPLVTLHDGRDRHPLHRQPIIRACAYAG